MSWRTVVISRRCKLDFKMGYIVIRSEETTRIFLDEISVLMIENPAVSMTGVLLHELSSRKIKVIFCDVKRMPYGELVPYYGSHDCSRCAREQAKWTDELKSLIWAEIVKEKIRKQAWLLKERGDDRESNILQRYAGEVQPGAPTNREGLAAKMYFAALFGSDFSREANGETNNGALNYGYGLLLSIINREICANGYLTQFGVHHNSVYNCFNLGSDLMEPFRIIVDKMVCEKNFEFFETEEKHQMMEITDWPVIINGTRQTVLNAAKIYVKSVFDAIEHKCPDMIRFYDFP